MKTLFAIVLLFISNAVISQNTTCFANTGETTYYSLEVALLHPERVLFLDLSDAFLTEFPTEIKELTNLVGLDLSNNQLSSIPEKLLSEMELEELYISGNPFVGPKEDIVENVIRK